MHLTPREQEKLLIFTAAEVARRRRARGLRLNHPEAVALITAETLEGIQPSIVEEIAHALRRIKAEGRRAIVLVEQYLEFARALCDRFYVMEKGAIAWEGERSTFDMDEVKRFLSV